MMVDHQVGGGGGSDGLTAAMPCWLLVAAAAIY